MMKSAIAWLAIASLFPAAAAAQWDSAPPAPQPQYEPAAPAESPPAISPKTPVTMEGLEIYTGLGLALPMGDIMKNSSGTAVSMSDYVSAGLPLSFGLGYRANPLFSFGVTFQYAPLSTKNCDPGYSCSASDIRAGFEGRFHFSTEESFSPWISLGIGQEWFNMAISGGGDSADVTLKGLDFDFQVGGNFRLGPVMTLGPFLGLRFGSFDSESASISGSGSGQGDIPDANQASHLWLAVGMRGTFNL